MELWGQAALAWDSLLAVVFFVQHSGMIRRGLRARLSPVIPAHYHGALFTIVSGIVLTTLVVFWQPSGSSVYELKGPVRLLMRGFFFMAVAGLGWGVYALRQFDPFGGGALRAYLSGKPLRPQQFVARGPYLWVRHPFYFFVLVMIWSCPDLTGDRLLFNILWTLWICVGAVLEEADLVAQFGEAYRAYRRRVPMLIPWPKISGSQWLKVLILASAAALPINQPVWALEFGEPPPTVELKGELGGRLDATPWCSDELREKLSVVFYVSPDEKDTNNPASEALDKEKFPADRFRSYGIINMAASMMPNFLINAALKEKQKRYPLTIYVRDYNKVLVNAWKIADHSSDVLVFDRNAILIFRKDGKLTSEEIEKLVKTVRDNL